jgi:carbonic anhydrase
VLKDLIDGNHRFAEGKTIGPHRSPADYRAVAAAQKPEAIVVTCADSRVPPEILFDQGVGDLFVVRVAGNVVTGAGPVVKGSIEYGVAELGAQLIFVLGHSNCGAVKAAIEQTGKKEPLPGEINGLVELVKPAVARVSGKPGNMLDNAIAANVELGVLQLQGLQPILAPKVKSGGLKVVGGVYDLKTGIVTMTSGETKARP